MNQIICPNCGAAIPIDESAFEGIVRQVRDEQFAAELAQRQQLMEHEKEQALQIARQGFQNQLQGSLAERDAKIAQLEAALSAARDQQELASRQAATEAASQARQQAATERDQLVRKAATEREEAQRAYAELQRRADALEAQLARQDDAARARARAGQKDERGAHPLQGR